jgi:hypothetical protein
LRGEILMPTVTTRWNLVVSSDTDKSLRQFLADQGGHKGDLSRFVDEAVRRQIFRLSVEAIKRENTSKTPEEIDVMVAEAIAWAQQRRR